MPPTVPSPLTFRTLRLLADEEFHSGEELARTLRVSRTTVWKALHGLEEWGITLFKVHGRGYRLVTPVEWLDVQQIHRHLGAHREDLQAHVVDVVESTNSVLLAEAEAGAPSGLAVAASVHLEQRDAPLLQPVQRLPDGGSGHAQRARKLLAGVELFIGQQT
jgi:biotin operon repressor BirA-like protein